MSELYFRRPVEIDNNYIKGNQRSLDKKRSIEIASFLATENSSIPNSIILSENYDEWDNFEVDPAKRWEFEPIGGDDSKIGEIVIPDRNIKLCSIIDGQHRVGAFDSSSVDMDLPCSIFLDLPPSLQAYIFATINFNQKKVDKSLAYQLFGYQLEDSSSSKWSPDMLGVKFSREFNKSGPFKNRISLIKGNPSKSDWNISSAAFVEGVVSLISGNPKIDKYEISKEKILGSSDRKSLKDNKSYPLRKYFINQNDKAVYEVIDRYFRSLDEIWWFKLEADSILFRTVGISAQFAFLKYLLVEGKVVINSDLNFDNVLQPLGGLRLNGEYFSAKSATKSRVLAAMKLACGFIKSESVDQELLYNIQ